MDQLYQNASIGPMPGEIILVVGVLFNVVIMAFGWLTIGLQQASGEVLPRYGPAARGVERIGQVSGGVAGRLWFRSSRRREQLVSFVITREPEVVSKAIMDEVGRGVTSMPAKGMYSGSDKAVLLCALTVTEVANLRSAVEKVDHDAFVIVASARQVLGGGFLPLDEREDAGGP